MKTEMNRGIGWRKASDLEAAIDDYMGLYSNQRIMTKLDGMIIAEHRDMLAKVFKKTS